MKNLHAARGCYELQQGGIALVEHLKSIRELNKHSIQDMVDLLRSEKETAVSKVYQIDTVNLLLPFNKMLLGLAHLSILSIDMGINGTLGRLGSLSTDVFLSDGQALPIVQYIYVCYSLLLKSFLQKQSLDGEISRLQRQLEMMETEYKLVDKTRVKALQVLQHLFPTLPKLFPWT